MFTRCWFAVCVALLAASCAAQDINDVHVRPPEARSPAPSNDALKTHTRPLVSNVDVVLVPVNVTDMAGRIVTGLGRTHFAVFEDGKPQTIEYFYTQDAPISMGIIFDQSGSMHAAVDTERDAVDEFIKESNPDDEFFLITFANKPQIVGDFTDSPENIAGRLVYSVPRGFTALWDAVYLGINKLQSARYPKKVLMVFSDGGENNSRYTAKELLRFVRESDVQIYGVAIPGQDYGPSGMSALSAATGGRTFLGPPSSFVDLTAKVALELRNQYVLGYRPANRAHDGKYRKIRVQLRPPPGVPPLIVNSKKEGYYAPEN